MPSQLGQDLFVLEILDEKRSGFFIDSGASDGLHGNNTELLERVYGWTGICVEPNEHFFAQLVLRRRRSICLNCCLYDRDGRVDFLEAGVLGGIPQEFKGAHLQRAQELVAPTGDAAAHRIVRKAARTLRSVLSECGAPREIDYWSLDTEGSELTLLQNFPFQEYSVRVLTVEHNGHTVQHDIRRFLESQGYFMARTFGIDDCYVRWRPRLFPAWRSAVWPRKGGNQMTRT